MHSEYIRKIMDVSKRFYRKNMVNAYEGNVSIQTDDFLYITPTGVNKDTYVPEDICVFDRATGEQILGNRKPSSELIMHQEVYKVRPDVHAVVHTHSPYLTMFAMCRREVYNYAHPEIIARFNVIKVADYGRSGTEGIVAGALPILENESNIVLLANHGVLACGHDLEDVFNTIEAAESIARNLTIIKDVGTPVNLPDDEIKTLQGKYKMRFETYKNWQK